MIKGLIGVAIGIVTYIVVSQLTTALITGTGTGDVIPLKRTRVVTPVRNRRCEMWANSGNPKLMSRIAVYA